jgi:hypothetical protein
LEPGAQGGDAGNGGTMRLKKIIKQFDMEEYNRRKITLGTDVRLNPQTDRVQLKAAGGSYPTADDLYVKTWVANPNSVKGWVGFEAEAIYQYDDLGDPVTFLNFRLGDGTDEYYHDGANWVVSTANWNTEDEVAVNIGTFPYTSKKIQVITNLKTINAAETPELICLKVLYESNVEFTEDLIYRSLIPMLKAGVRPIANYPIKMVAAGTTIDLNDFPLETPYNLVEIDSVFNHTSDPDHFNDLFQSYDDNTKIITLSASIPQDEIAWIQFLYEPLVAVLTDQEYQEFDKIPAVILSDISVVNSFQIPMPADSVSNKVAGFTVVVPGPRQKDVEIVAQIITDKGSDQARLADEFQAFFANNREVVSHAIDEPYDILVTTDYDSRSAPSQKGLHAGIFSFKIKKALYFQEQETDVPIVKRFIITGDIGVTIE